MNEYNINVDFSKGRISTNLRKLVQNDYNTTKLNFTFDKEEGRVLFKMLYPDGTQYVTDIQNNELIFGEGILIQEGDYEYEISLYTEDGRLTDYATKSFEVRKELVDTDEIVEVDDRVPVLDNLINEVNTIKNDVEEGKFNGKDGVTPAIGDNGNWFVGEEDTGVQAQGPQGEAGPAGGISLEEVKAITGELDNLSTEDKSNLVNAINEVLKNGGSSGIYKISGITNLVSNMALGADVVSQILSIFNNNIGKAVIIFLIDNYGKNIILPWSVPLITEAQTNQSRTRGGIYISYLNSNRIGSVQCYLKTSNDLKQYTELSINLSSFALPILPSEASLITGIFNFQTLPRAEIVPTLDDELVNKKYVDDLIGSGMKITEITEGEIHLGDDLASGYYLLRSGVKYRCSSATTFTELYYDAMFFKNARYGYLFQTTQLVVFNLVNAITYYVNLDQLNGLVKYDANTHISGKYTFTTLPETSKTPTTDNQLVNKKYVDDAIASLKAELAGGE